MYYKLFLFLFIGFVSINITCKMNRNVYFIGLMITTPSGNTHPFESKREGMRPLLKVLKINYIADADQTATEIDGQPLICRRPNRSRNLATVITAKGKIFTFTWNGVYKKPSLGQEGDDCYSDDDIL